MVATSVTDAEEPQLGAGFCYLVTADNWFGEGRLGPSGQQPPRINDDQCPSANGTCAVIP